MLFSREQAADPPHNGITMRRALSRLADWRSFMTLTSLLTAMLIGAIASWIAGKIRGMVALPTLVVGVSPEYDRPADTVRGVASK